ncbi:hypothetical protein GUITHDRAFT_132939 [Guillardia theta CCMP2712]|uniref:Uncharacterized protein n=1 Tax=Guillardia theta (strain CCMP2712) TaxID=905079 RepID=L1JY73_GUITC|nr:hypothetical protein GUITHDRAFT_132939 [Guillardia theta CCMP2712]EKX53175.1 hypothetical protein GUITHDRAFT_132939 [Guillardia theta CCMP2712]|eukprot:XP_005840155.1 hypothetical protein GUITHDRAFT_132939 [Guillardia theta CCMP2712]
MEEGPSGRQGAWQDSVFQMELEANEELVQSFRQRMEEAEKSKAELEAELEKAKRESEETFQSMQNRLDQQEHENFVLRENALRLHRELDAIRSTFMEKQKEGDDEVNRLRNELRLARRHEEYLSKELERQKRNAESTQEEMTKYYQDQIEKLKLENIMMSESIDTMVTGRSIKSIFQEKLNEPGSD